jgi:hypothetical protein
LTRGWQRVILTLLLAGASGSLAGAQTGQVQLAWDAVDPNVTDLAGYRVHFDSDPNSFLLAPAQARAAGVQSMDVDPNTTTTVVPGIPATTNFFFSVTAFDLSGNESGFSNLVSSTGFVTPTVRSLSPNSAGQGSTGLSVTISGDAFLAGATVDFGDPNGITINNVDDTGVPGALVVDMDIGALARVASRAVSVTNPGGATGIKPSAFTVDVNVARVDIDGSNRIDGGDFVLLLLGYPSAAGDSRYSTRLDLDVDGLVDGADLAIFFTYFGLMAPFP